MCFEDDQLLKGGTPKAISLLWARLAEARRVEPYVGSASRPCSISALLADNKDVSVMMSEMDVNAIAGTLKLYFRELPEPLFTDEFYPNFAEGIGEQGRSPPCLSLVPQGGQGVPSPPQSTFQSKLQVVAGPKNLAVLEGQGPPIVPPTPSIPGGHSSCTIMDAPGCGPYSLLPPH